MDINWVPEGQRSKAPVGANTHLHQQYYKETKPIKAQTAAYKPLPMSENDLYNQSNPQPQSSL